MAYPEGMRPKTGCDTLHLLGSLYGLKQSGRTWWIELEKDSRRWDSSAQNQTGVYICCRV